MGWWKECEEWDEFVEERGVERQGLFGKERVRDRVGEGRWKVEGGMDVMEEDVIHL